MSFVTDNPSPILGGIEADDVVTVTMGTLAFVSKDAGTRAVTGADYGIGGTHAWKYYSPIAQPSFENAVISPKELTVQDASHTKAYDNTTSADVVAVTLTGFVTGDTGITANEVSAVYTSASTGTTTINITNVTLQGVGAGNYTVTPRSGITVAGITKRPLSIQSAAHTKVFDNTALATGVTVTLTGFVTGQNQNDVTIETITAVYTNVNAGTTTVNITGVEISGAIADNYTVTPRNGVTVTGITKKPLDANMIASINDLPYSGAAITPTPAVTDTAALIQVSDYTWSYSNNINAGQATATITATTSGNYSGSASKIFIIEKAAYNGIVSINSEVPSGGTTNRTITLPIAPTGMSYATNYTLGGTNEDLLDGEATITGTAMIFSTKAGNEDDAFTVTISVIGAVGANFNDYTVTVTITLKDISMEPPPTASVDFISESLVGFAPNAAYEIEGTPMTADANGSVAVNPAWLGNTIEIVKIGITEQGTIDSDTQTLVIPARPAAPTGLGKGDTTGGVSNGVLTGLDSSMEYRLGTGAWTDIGGETVTNLAAGTYQVRYKATTDAFVSEVISILIAASSDNINNGVVEGGGSFSSAGTINEPATDDPMTPQGETIIDSETPLAWPNSYADVNAADWFYDAVRFVTETGLMNGTDNNRFSPNDITNRAMLVTVLYRLEGEPDVSGSIPFSDVNSDQWYSNAILWASQNDIVNGYSNGAYGLNDPITREQAVTILYRYAEFKGLDVSASIDLSGYSDLESISDWAMDAMKWAVAEGIVQGRTTTTIAPEGTSTRAEVATILKDSLRFFLAKAMRTVIP